LTWWHWPLTLKTNKVPNSHKDKVCTKFGQNPLKDVDSRVCTRMLCGKHLTPWPLTLKINRVPDSPKDYVCTKFGQNPFKDLDSRVFTRILCSKNWPSYLDLWSWKSIGFQILLRSKYVPSLVKIHWRMLILECSQGGYAVKIWPGDIDLWPMTLKTNKVPNSHKD
jgi:hypothetical protein